MTEKAPFDFILDFLPHEGVDLRPMFGCHGIFYAGHMVLFLRMREDDRSENGIWIAAGESHADALADELGLGPPDSKDKKKWILIPVDHPEFESKAREVCELIANGDTRIGR